GENGLDEMLRGEMVFSTPSRSTGDLAETDDARVRVHPDQQKWRGRVRPARGPDHQSGAQRNADRNGFNASDLHTRASEHQASGLRTSKQCALGSFLWGRMHFARQRRSNWATPAKVRAG